MDESAHEQRCAATVEALGDALRTRDLAALGAVLADDVRWYDCRTRADVLATMRQQFAAAAEPPQLREVRATGDHAILRIALPGQHDERWFVLTLDDDGLITSLLDYSSEAAAEHDIALRARGPQASPAPAVTDLVPFVHVADMVHSVAFYALLGFATVATYEPDGKLVWAFLETADGAPLMLARADAPIDHHEQAVLFYLYADDLVGLRDHLVGHGLIASEIFDGTPGPKQEMRVSDPDGYVLMIAQVEPDA